MCVCMRIKMYVDVDDLTAQQSVGWIGVKQRIGMIVVSDFVVGQEIKMKKTNNTERSTCQEHYSVNGSSSMSGALI